MAGHAQQLGQVDGQEAQKGELGLASGLGLGAGMRGAGRKRERCISFEEQGLLQLPVALGEPIYQLCSGSGSCLEGSAQPSLGPPT